LGGGVEVGLGFFATRSTPTGGGGVLASFLAHVRWKSLVAGMVFDSEAALLATAEQHVAPVVGLGLHPVDHLRLDLLLEVGGHRVAGIGNDFLSASVSPAEAWLPYVGARMGVAWVSHGDVAFVAGAWLTARSDLGSTMTYPTTSSFAYFGTPPSNVVPTPVGGTELAGALRLGCVY
jgi:hypothetical protein